MTSGIIFGGYGTFGAHVARELARLGLTLTIAGRDLRRASAFARSLGTGHGGLAVDVTHPDSCRQALPDQQVAVNCAGPFGALGTTLLEACLVAGCHYVDITDDRGYSAQVCTLGSRFNERGLAAVYGCSSLPAISGALALCAHQGSAAAPELARVTLFIGNDNPKGKAAAQSLVSGLGRPIAAPQGNLRGFRDREVVPLPSPFGRRAVFNFDSPEYDLFPQLLGVRSVRVKLGFELGAVNYAFAALALLGRKLRARHGGIAAAPRAAAARLRDLRRRDHDRALLRRRVDAPGRHRGARGRPANGGPALRVRGPRTRAAASTYPWRLHGL